MEFLNFLARRLNVSKHEATLRLEQALDNYRPARDYSSRLLDSRGGGGEHSPSPSADAQG
jgi:hypothetical protein